MDAYGLFGFPVHHSWSPFIHGLFARQTVQEMTYHLFESRPASFRHDVLDFFFTQGGCGCNVTLPHKRAAAELVNELTARAQRADAVNTIVRREGKLVGDNTDGVGLLTDLRQNLGLRFNAPRILMLGAGGAARGVLAPLLDLRPALLLIANRTPERAVELAREFADLGPTQGTSFAAAALQQPFDLVVNATSASLHGEVPPVPRQSIGAQTACYDMAYGLGETAFTTWARQAGAAVVAQGWGMLVEQAAVAFELWRGVHPVTRPVLNALQEHAAAKAAARTPA
ncbi:MAG TPA: shikimate dehydrogenase [Steroidobacteraceae bacterium]